MTKKFTSLGLMSGTSGDGVDASLIETDGNLKYEAIKDKYYEYDEEIFQKFHSIKEKINKFQDIKSHKNEINDLEKKITLFHARVIKNFSDKHDFGIVGVHGQTIYHSPKEKVSIQLINSKLLAQLTKKKIVFNFRERDLKNGGEGAPLSPIFHKLIIKQKKLDLPVCILNIGGISNVTILNNNNEKRSLLSRDIGPGNCMIDTWVRKNSKKKFDKNGELASNGLINKIVLEQVEELIEKQFKTENFSFDTNDFDISFIRGLTLEDGAATLTNFTANFIGSKLEKILSKYNNHEMKIFVCGGGRKNLFLLKQIKEYTNNKFKILSIDKLEVDGDFIESQAFAYLAIRSILKLPISFPETTGCKTPTTGGEII